MPDTIQVLPSVSVAAVPDKTAARRGRKLRTADSAPTLGTSTPNQSDVSAGSAASDAPTMNDSTAIHELLGASDAVPAYETTATPIGDLRETASDDLLAAIVDQYRTRKALLMAEGDMGRRIKSKARSVASYRMKRNGIEVPEGKMPETTDEDMAVVLKVYPSFFEAVNVMHKQRLDEEKELIKLVRRLPIMASWAQHVRGLAAVSVATLIGEAGGAPTRFSTVQKLWKRYGLAVIDGRAQRRVLDPEQAARHGYNPSRRAAIYVVGENMIRTSNKHAREVYDPAKDLEIAKIGSEEIKMTKGWAHKRALRKVQKQLVLGFYVAWEALAKGEPLPPKAAAWMGAEKAPKKAVPELDDPDRIVATAQGSLPDVV